MSDKVTVEVIGGGVAFVVRAFDKKGAAKSAETYHADKVMDRKEVAKVFISDFKNASNYRKAYQSALADIFENSKMDGYKGKGDPKTGKTSTEFKQSLLACESMYFDELHKKGLLPIVVPKDSTPEMELQTFITTTRKNGNYANIKSICAKYFAFCGVLPKNKAGYLIPYAVMQAEILKVMDIAPVDNSVAARLVQIKTDMDKDTGFKLEDALKAAPLAKALLVTLEGIIAHYAELATHARTNPVDILDESSKALETAAAQTKMRRAPRPEPADATV